MMPDPVWFFDPKFLSIPKKLKGEIKISFEKCQLRKNKIDIYGQKKIKSKFTLAKQFIILLKFC